MDKQSDHLSTMVQSFLNERAVQKLIPERDSEIARVTHLLDQLKKAQKETAKQKVKQAN